MPERDTQWNPACVLELARRGKTLSARTAYLNGGIAAMCCILSSPVLRAQDALRYSLAGDAAAEAQRQAFASQPYTFKEGDFKLLVVPSLELDYNDDVNLTQTGSQQDFILKPLVTFSGGYPITEQNLLSFNVGAGYDEYLEHSQYSNYRLNSDSSLLFDVRVKDFLIDFHDRVTFTQDPAIEPSIAGTALYGGLLNSAGLSTTWDLEDVTLTLGYDHQNFVSSSSEFNYLNRASELSIARIGAKLRPDLTVGVEGTASFTRYDQNVLNDNQSYSGGVYGDWKPDSFLHVEPRVGYGIYQFEETSESAQVFDLTPTGTPIIVPTGEVIRTANLSSWYADLTVSHEISEIVKYALSAGHEIRLGIQSDAVEATYVRPSITWSIIKDLTLQTSISYEHGQQGFGNISGNVSETYDWVGAGFSVGYAIMRKLMVNLNYRLTVRTSNANEDYTQNLVGIQLTYRPE